MPVGGNQLAEAFLWKVAKQLRPSGAAAMLVPAMTLFKDESTSFRQQFFDNHDVWCVANFANLAYVLFAKRVETPAAAIFYTPKMKGCRIGSSSPILHFAPFVATQEANRPEKPSKKLYTWNIVINGSEVREIPRVEALSGNPLVWKIAMWGSHLDMMLLRSVEGRFECLQAVRETLGLEMNQGVELRTTGVYIDELVDKNTVDSKRLRGCGRIYSFPNDSLYKITKEYAHLREGRDDLPLRVSRPPHVIVDAARRFAVYSDSFIAVPARNVGIAGKPEQSDLLKMISLYLMSDFALYHQFLTSPQMGIYKSIADLNTLKQLPFPFEEIVRGGLSRWSKLHGALVSASVRAGARPKDTSTPSLFDQGKPDDDIGRLERELNELVNDALGLRPSDRWLIRDLVHTRMTLTKGKVDPFAIDAPSPEKDIRPYCEVLKEELDSLVEVVTDDRYLVDVIHEKDSAMIMVHRAPARSADKSIRILPANAGEAQSLRQIRQDLLQRHSQWLYFERAMRRYRKETGEIYLFKPMQRLYWLRSQALIDAGEVIADLAAGGEE